MRSYRYLTVIAGLFTATLVITNILNTKIFDLLGFAFPVGIITFPVTFLAADLLTEVYGYKITRQVIWSGFLALIFMALAATAAVHLTPAGFWPLQSSFESILNQLPRIVIASILAYWSGEFCNSYVLAKSKVRTDGRAMPVRFITSTAAGQAVDTLVFMGIAFIGVYPASAIIPLFVSSWAFKVLWEVVALPISLPLAKWLKREESEDYFDIDTNFSPFSLDVKQSKN